MLQQWHHSVRIQMLTSKYNGAAYCRERWREHKKRVNEIFIQWKEGRKVFTTWDKSHLLFFLYIFLFVFDAIVQWFLFYTTEAVAARNGTEKYINQDFKFNEQICAKVHSHHVQLLLF